MVQATTVKRKAGKDLTEGPILKLLLSFALPIIATNLIQQLYSLVDLMVIGQYVGSIGTVGVSTGGEISDIMTPLATALASAGQVYIAQQVGQKDEEGVKETIGTLLTFILLISFVCLAVCVIFSGQILTLLNCPEEAFYAARQYMIITSIGMPFIFGYNAVCGMLRGMGESKRPLEFITVAAVVNIFLDILLVAVFKLDVVGTTIATMLAQFGSFAAAFRYMYKNREQFDFELKFSYFKLRWKPLRIMLMLGIPQFVRVICVRFSMLWVNSNINSFGLVVSATNSIGNKLNKFLEVFVQGVDQASGAMIGQNLGARKQDRAKKTVWTTLGCTLTIAAVLIVIVNLFPTQLFRIFTTDQEVIQYGITYLRILSVAILMGALIGPFNSMISGSGFPTLSLVIGLLDGVVRRIGLSYIYANVLGLGANGYFWANATCRILPCLVSITYYASGKWKTRKLLSER